jgi:SAM-dependent methyltransferase/aminoglycoside phosphotransferase (APT) family kinase protein
VNLDLRCPYCSAALEARSGALGCPSCDRRFLTVEGILCLADVIGDEADETGLPGTAALLNECERLPWQQALEKAAGLLGHPLEFLEKAVSPCQASWWPLARLTPQCRVLNLNCGWGATAFSLAQHAADIVACDPSLSRLRFAQARARQDGVTNLTLLRAGDTPRLPFAKEEFDLVVLDACNSDRLSVLIGGGEGTAWDILLKEMVRVLTPEGQLVLVVPNRWDWRKIRAAVGKWLPSGWRHVAKSGGASYSGQKAPEGSRREPARSLRGYRTFLQSAGLSQAHAWIPMPNAKSYRALLDPAVKGLIECYFCEQSPEQSESLRLRVKSALAPLVAPSYCWIASRRPGQRAFLDRLGEHISQVLLPRTRASAACVRYRITRREIVTCEMHLGGRAQNIIVRIPLSPAGAKRAQQEQEALRSAHEILGRAGEWPEIPRPLLEGELERTPFFVQDALPGLPGHGMMTNRSQAARCKKLALDFLLRLHLAARSELVLDEGEWRTRVIPLIAEGLQAMEERAGISSEKLNQQLSRVLVGMRLPLVFRHGDYWPGNLFFDAKAERITGVIDWDRAESESLPLLDLLDTVISCRAEEEKTAAPRVLGRMLQEGLQKEDRAVVDQYLGGLGFSLSDEQLRAFLKLDWLVRLTVRAAPRHSAWWGEFEWLRENVPASAAWFRSADHL